jgi:hypothetical protein
MTETEQRALGPSLQPGEIAAGIAKDAQENLAGLDVVRLIKLQPTAHSLPRANT